MKRLKLSDEGLHIGIPEIHFAEGERVDEVRDFGAHTTERHGHAALLKRRVVEMILEEMTSGTLVTVGGTIDTIVTIAAASPALGQQGDGYVVKDLLEGFHGVS
jgi:hypothetical protein